MGDYPTLLSSSESPKGHFGPTHWIMSANIIGASAADSGRMLSSPEGEQSKILSPSLSLDIAISSEGIVSIQNAIRNHFEPF